VTILVTGGAGFIGANFIHDWLAAGSEPVVSLDALTYAGSTANLAGIADDSGHTFVHGTVSDGDLVASLLRTHSVRAIVHFAAETHVDRAIADPGLFYETNVLGTIRLLDSTRAYLATLSQDRRRRFRFIHVSTDEVYGSLGPRDGDFTEASPYRPSNPYAASKAASDHAVRAAWHTFAVPAIVTNCSNNYGPRQLPEKLVPLMIARALEGRSLPIYGSGLQVRDWLYVGDHCAALRAVLASGKPGESYNIGARMPLANIEVVRTICRLLDRLHPRCDGRSYASQIEHVRDRPGHDQRYGIDPSKIERELGWRAAQSFEDGMAATIQWYLAGADWLSEAASDPAHRAWMEKQYA
jgi:dTDP-glucose 4,6-dehydratase